MKRKLVARILVALLVAALPLGLAAQETGRAKSTTAFTPGLKAMEDIRIFFFAGGDEGDAYASTVYKGALDAKAILGCRVDFVFSGWNSEKMTNQFREAIAQRPDGICMMGHPGKEALTPLWQDAVNKGIYVQLLNVDVPEIRKQFGGTLIGPDLVAQGQAVAEGVIKKGKLKAGDIVGVAMDWSQIERAVREGAAVKYLGAKGIKVIKLNTPPEQATSPELFIPEFTAFIMKNRNAKGLIFPGNQHLGATPMYFSAANLKPGALVVAGFGLDPTVLRAMKEGYVQVTAGQHGYMEGFLGIISVAMHVMYGYGPISYDNSAALITTENYKSVEAVIQAGVGF